MNTEFTIEQLFLNEELRKEQSQYPQYVINLHNAILARNGFESVLPNIEKMLKTNKDKTIELLNNILSIIKRAKNDESIRIDAKDLESKSWSNYSSGFSKYISILEGDKSISKCESQKEWNGKYGEMGKNAKILAERIDGTDSLLKAIAKDKWSFIEIVLANSYFFDPNVVSEQHNHIVSKYKATEKLPARWTEWYNSEKDPSAPFPGEKKEEIKEKSRHTLDVKYANCPVEIDSDGNYEVKNLIKNKFGYTVSWGQNSIIQFYKISHIWGEAYDPRKFTNLWNIVLVPAWANDLLDKTYSRDELTITFKQVIKSVCIKFYKMKKLDWDIMDDKKMPSHIEDHEEDMIAESTQSHSFKVKWIEERNTESNSLGKIRTRSIRI